MRRLELLPAFALSLVLASLVAGCGGADADGDGGPTGDTGGETDADGTDTSADPGDGDGDGDGDEGTQFDVGVGGDGDGDGDPPSCKVEEDGDGVGPCEMHAAPDSFEPDIQWEWAGEGEYKNSVTTPLVANLTDDNDDGVIDLCDVPDVVVVAYGEGCAFCNDARIFVLDGETGALHFEIQHDVANNMTPALGDVDGDGLVEIVAQGGDQKLAAFSNEGVLEWTSTETVPSFGAGLADFDNDGDVEIYAGAQIFDHQGNVAWQDKNIPYGYSPVATAADLDGDGDLELITGRAAFHHDGTLAWSTNALQTSTYPQVADLDADGLPEVLMSSEEGLSIFEHDGTPKQVGVRPTGEQAGVFEWYRALNIHDFDGDGEPEYAVKSKLYYSVIETDLTLKWKSLVNESSTGSGGTAFDFLGDGKAEAMYADEHTFFVFDDVGAPYLEVPRTSFTSVEYPIVADLDNDGSAEVAVVSNGYFGNGSYPPLQVVRDAEDRWVPARRIWNQHAYHVTNVREDGTIPQYEKPSWKLLNTFRTQAQIEGGICKPEPEG